MDDRSENICLKAELHQLRRVNLFEKRWLKKNHPEVFEALQKASEKNEENYVLSQMNKLNDHLNNRSFQ
jgi:hypothetical protein